jgi:hypothetical protein
MHLNTSRADRLPARRPAPEPRTTRATGLAPTGRSSTASFAAQWLPPPIASEDERLALAQDDLMRFRDVRTVEQVLQHVLTNGDLADD